MNVRPLSMGIGLHTGDVIVGNIGSKFRMKYSVVGSGVNLVSRVESCTVGGQIMITEATKNGIRESIQTGKTISVGMKGFRSDVELHELVGVREPYNLFLDTADIAYPQLSAPLPVTIHILDGKSISDAAVAGSMTKLGSQGGSIDTTHEIPELNDIKLVITDERSGTEHAIYAKVTSSSGDTSIDVRFTGVSPETSDQVETWISERT